ncbi:MAG: hypothetical protein M3R67_01215 [Acidobacteriota bacterium]|nr:hypothetical protein [Acidobacteriota bacterium]
MNVSLIVLWALVGWCGSEPRIIRFPWPGPPVPDPDPEPWWLVSRIIGVAAGILGGWGFTQVFGPQPEPWRLALPAATSAVGAYVVARVVTDVYAKLTGAKNMARG